jgi:gamma-glutamyltranspeptidase/glutathione hydrolase
VNAARAVVAAGHPVSARAGADVLRAGGNAVDAALGAMLAALTCEPLLTGLGAGGYMLVALPGSEPVLLDFFVAAPGRAGVDPQRPAAALDPVQISFDDAVQTFHVGVASAGTYGFPAGVQEAATRFGTVALKELTAPAATLAREGVILGREQAHIVAILAAIVTSTPEAAALFAPHGRLLGAEDRLRQPELGDSLERLGSDGAAPFYTGEIAARVVQWLGDRGGLVSADDLAAYSVLSRDRDR